MAMYVYWTLNGLILLSMAASATFGLDCFTRNFAWIGRWPTCCRSSLAGDPSGRPPIFW